MELDLDINGLEGKRFIAVAVVALVFSGAVGFMTLESQEATKTVQAEIPADTNRQPSHSPGLNLSKTEIKQTAGKLVENGFMPSNETINQPRPYTVNGKEVIIAKNGVELMTEQDPAYPNGVNKKGEPIIPEDLTEEQRKTYISLLYGDDLKWKEEARNPEDSSVLGGCIFCNAPAGAGGCYKKQVLRGLVYNLVKKGWSEKQIRKEATIWMKSIFGGDPFLYKGIYYKKTGKDPAKISANLDTLSEYGRNSAIAKITGRNYQSKGGTQGCGTSTSSNPCGTQTQSTSPCGT
jgi:hypothetical protein